MAEVFMDLLFVGMIVLALLVYLAYSLIYPERF
jgi:K+-transporting ATPase KdpF subunit